jgi:photosystem II stability/assembly factor-like uncharacterized protein
LNLKEIGSVKGPGRDLATWCAFGVIGFVALALTTQASAGLNQWTILGPTGDEVYSIAVAPSLLSTVYVGTAQNAAIKTTDGGATWAALGPSGEVDSLAVDPTNPNTVLVANQNDGIYRSTDGGANWQYGTYDYQELIAVGYAPSDHLRAYAGGWNGVVIRSTDGGASWGMAGTVPGQVLSIAVSPASPDTVYVATQGPPYRSTDGGATWAVLSLPIANYLVFSSDGSLLAGTAGWYDCPGGGVSRSTDDGSTWTSLGLSLPAGAGAVAAIVASSADPATIYAGTMGSGVFKTTDGGGTWAPTALVSTSINALATGATANDVYAGAVGAGLLESSDGGTSWQPVNTLLGSWTQPNTYITSLQRAPGTVSGLIASQNGVGMRTSNDFGSTWSPPIAVPDARVISFVVDSSDASRWLISTRCAPISLSTDAGLTWTPSESGLGTALVRWLVQSPANPSLVYALTMDGLYGSTDGGLSWARVGQTEITGLVSGIGLDPSSPTRIFAATYTGGSFRSTDQGTTWQALPTLPNDLRAFEFPADGSILTGGPTSGVLRSTDGGDTWAPQGGGYVFNFAIDPSSPSTIYAGGGRIGKSTDMGISWTEINVDPYAGVINSVVPDPADSSHVLTASIFRGVMSLYQAPPVISLIQPSSISNAGNTSVSISGDGFMENAIVEINGIRLSSTYFVDAQHLIIYAPPHAVGSVSVMVLNPTGFSATVPNGITYVCDSPPDAQFDEMYPPPYCGAAPSRIWLRLTGLAPWSITWSDGFVQTFTDYSAWYRDVTPATTTTYTLTAFSDSSNCGPATFSGSVTVQVLPYLPPPTVAAAAQALAGERLTASVQNPNPGSFYFWSIENGSLPNGSEGNSITFIVGSTGITRLHVYEHASSGCDSSEIILDIAITPNASAVHFYTVPPCRLIDTRRPAGTYGGPPLSGNGSTRDFPVAGQCGIPADAQAVSANVTVVNPGAGGDIRIYPTGFPSSTSVLNFRAGQTRANNAILALTGNPSGSMTVQADIPNAGVNLIVDVNGYFR